MPPVRRFLIWPCIILLLLVSGAGVSSANRVVQPLNRLYLNQEAKLTAVIPASWEPDRSLVWDYADGYEGIFSGQVEVYSEPIPTLTETCVEQARLKGITAESVEPSLTTWRGHDACLIEAAKPFNRMMLVIVEEPDEGVLASFTVVMVDTDHFDQVTDSISSDLSDITSVQILNATIDWISVRSLWRDEIDWDKVREQAQTILTATPGEEQFTIAMQYVIDELKAVGGDDHNWFQPAQESASPAQRGFAQSEAIPTPVTAELTDGIGYFTLPGFSGTRPEGEAYVSPLHDAILAQQATTCGWIVDLRSNNGGYMNPMILGLAPFLPLGPFIGFENVNGETYSISLDDAWDFSLVGGLNDGQVIPGYGPPSPLFDEDLRDQPIAVLTGPVTASSGEGTAIALRTRENTMFFGETTSDLATAPTQLRLLDGSTLSIATSWMLDTRGETYPDGIVADVEVSPSDMVLPLEDDPVVAEASAWLERQAGCTGQ